MEPASSGEGGRGERDKEEGASDTGNKRSMPSRNSGQGGGRSGEEGELDQSSGDKEEEGARSSTNNSKISSISGQKGGGSRGAGEGDQNLRAAPTEACEPSHADFQVVQFLKKSTRCKMDCVE